MSEVFLDASYAIALSSVKDQYHQRAVALSEQLELDGTRLVTTRAVILEIGNALSKQKYREAAIELLTSLSEDPTVEIIPLPEVLFDRAFTFYQSHQDKEWGITDCISFVVMQDRGLTEALTADDHFQQAGYRALLKEF
ncbi:MAG: putative nucleic acid-binding protein [Candidatus Latescibacterota bacterium]|jgi:predicted nucleic acid-binding protein